jgi:hypothetical protein
MQFSDINNSIKYCLDVILKEAREEDRLVKQVIYTMLSAYTNNPLNLAINAPSGEGKTYVLQKVGDTFPKEDVMFLAGMTDKALFHSKGDLVVKNNDNEKYETLEDKVAKIDSDIQDKECEIPITKDKNVKQGLRSMISSWKKERKELIKESKKLIDLSHKVLVFLDSPRVELFNALMPLLSHDKYEVEYQFVDTYNGIKTKSNILRGWPAVIFAQAIDYSHYQRYPEIQRRFIITNPKMTTQKYEQAVDLISDKYGLPDFAYQAKIISDSDKERVREIILEIKQNMLAISDRVEPGKNNVIIPFNETISNLLPKDKAFDMTTANRFFGFLSLLPLINIDKRPRLLLRKKGSPVLQTIPFALFEDLQEATFLMEYADGVRPYILEWYYDIFLKAYDAKTEPDSKVNGKDQIVTEKRIALTTEKLVETTKEVYKQNYTTKKILETYINPLINQGYIDKTESDLDRRANIYYPVIISKNRKLLDFSDSNNFSQERKITITDSTLYPSKQYLISKIQQVLRYSAYKNLLIIIQNHEGKDITVEDLVDQYYNNPEKFFQLDNKSNKSTPEDSSLGESIIPTTIEESKSEIKTGLQQEQQSSSSSTSQLSEQGSEEKHENNFVKQHLSEDYLENVENASELQENTASNEKYIETRHSLLKKLFDPGKTNNLIYSNRVEPQDNELQQPSIPTTIASSVDQISPISSPQLQEQQRKPFNCFYCSQAYSSDKERVKHIDYEHPGKLYYPMPEDFEKRLL